MNRYYDSFTYNIYACDGVWSLETTSTTLPWIHILMGVQESVHEEDEAHFTCY